MILIPKYKELYIRGKSPSVEIGYSGEYRYTLRGPDGRVKERCDWRPNLLLNGGLGALRNDPYPFKEMHLGDDATAAVITQTGLIGADLSGGVAGIAPRTYTNGGSPNYERGTQQNYVFLAGVGTGTVREFILRRSYDVSPITGGSIRVVLTTPIVKGASDQLDIEHKTTHWPRITDATGTIDISGVSHDYILRSCNIGHVPEAMNTDVGLAPQAALLGDAVLGLNTSKPVGLSNVSTNKPSSYVSTPGGAVGTYYINHELIYDVDQANLGNVNCVQLPPWTQGADYSRFGIQWSFFETAGGASLVKLNTHELRLNVRLLPVRH